MKTRASASRQDGGMIESMKSAFGVLNLNAVVYSLAAMKLRDYAPSKGRKPSKSEFAAAIACSLHSPGIPGPLFTAKFIKDHFLKRDQACRAFTKAINTMDVEKTRLNVHMVYEHLREHIATTTNTDKGQLLEDAKGVMARRGTEIVQYLEDCTTKNNMDMRNAETFLTQALAIRVLDNKKMQKNKHIQKLLDLMSSPAQTKGTTTTKGVKRARDECSR